MTTTTSKPNVLTIDPSDLEELESKIAKLNRLNTPRVVEGDVVSLTATVEPKEPGFAIMKRPAKASKTSKAA